MTIWIYINFSVDPDPIYICEEIGVCPIADSATGKILGVSVNPATGRQGGTFVISIQWQVYNTTGTGELAFEVVPPEGEPLGDAVLLVKEKPNVYSAQFQFQANPSQEQPFAPGLYRVISELCEGTCGSIHPHSYVMGKGEGSFHITA